MPKDPGLLAEGKTKLVLTAADPGMCIFRMKDDVTMNDDPDQTIVVPGKGEWSNTTTCCMFDVLRRAGIPVAYVHQLSDNQMIAVRCTMIPLECVARRIARGSYCKRHGVEEGLRFSPPEVEFYLKTSKGVVRHVDGTSRSLPVPMVMKKQQERPLDDPLIANPQDMDMWELLHPQLPFEHHDSSLNIQVKPDTVLPPDVTVELLKTLTREAFLALEDGWETQGCALHDIKFEFGIGVDGNVYLADVVDADSWRLKDPEGDEISKQSARDGAPADIMAAKYSRIAALAISVRQAVCNP